MDINLILSSIPVMLEASVVTLQLTCLSLLVGLPLAAVLAAGRFSRHRAARWLTRAYVSVMRGTPVLVQLLVLFFGGPQIGLNLEPFTAGVVAFGLNIAAYMSEGIRGAILSVDKGQTEASRSLGFDRGQTMRFFILPQAARLMIRSMGVNAVILLKGTALIATIGVVDLTYSAQRLVTSTYKPFEVFGVAAVYYVGMVVAASALINWLELRLGTVGEARL